MHFWHSKVTKNNDKRELNNETSTKHVSEPNTFDSVSVERRWWRLVFWNGRMMLCLGVGRIGDSSNNSVIAEVWKDSPWINDVGALQRSYFQWPSKFSRRSTVSHFINTMHRHGWAIMFFFCMSAHLPPMLQRRWMGGICWTTRFGPPQLLATGHLCMCRWTKIFWAPCAFRREHDHMSQESLTFWDFLSSGCSHFEL